MWFERTQMFTVVYTCRARVPTKVDIYNMFLNVYLFFFIYLEKQHLNFRYNSFSVSIGQSHQSFDDVAVTFS